MSNSARARALRSALDRVPREPMLIRPTPVCHLPNLSARLGRDIYMKREDLSGLAMGGNKTRELDYFIGQAKSRGADVFIAGGGVAQSNHAVQCAAAAHRAGLKPVLVLHRFRAGEIQGNYLLSMMLGADIRFADSDNVDSDVSSKFALRNLMDEVAEEYARRGHVPYVLYSSFHPLGAVGFVDAALELHEQIDAMGCDLRRVYVTAAGATQAGLVVGTRYLEAPYEVVGISYTQDVNGLATRLQRLATDTISLLGLDLTITEEDFLNESYAGPGYGIPTEQGLEAIALVARTEGIFLDPVYTGKGMAGLLDHIRAGRIPPGPVLFVHTGGIPAIFAYSRDILKNLDAMEAVGR